MRKFEEKTKDVFQVIVGWQNLTRQKKKFVYEKKTSKIKSKISPELYVPPLPPLPFHSYLLFSLSKDNWTFN